MRLDRPPAGRLYHGVYPGTPGGEEDDVAIGDVRAYEALAGQRVAWVYFSHNWYHGHRFPFRTARVIRALGAVPFIRLMLRSSPEVYLAEPRYTLEAILQGQFDADLVAWARDARAFGTPLLVEYGTECNGEWFPWNGVWNGGLRRGPQRFVAAYRHIVRTMRQAGAANLTWVFHVAWEDDPAEPWNALERYYPGDDAVDWLAVSAYGAQTPQDESIETFRAAMDAVYPRLTALTPAKPIMVAEFGCTAGHPGVSPSRWARAALRALFAHRWPQVAGFSWWNERWQNDEDPAHDSDMRLQDLPALAQTFHTMLAGHADVLQTSPCITRCPFSKSA